MNLHTAALACLILALLPNAKAYTSTNCVAWFEKSKVQQGKSCLTRCASQPVDMGTFDCPSECDDLCKVSSNVKFLFKLSDLYPGLNPAEKALASEQPGKTLRAYQLSWKAEELCLKEYPRSDTNDASDACRHFVWAGLMTRETDAEFAQRVLDAHEAEPSQAEDQKAMDMANNQRGVTFVRTHDGKPDDSVVMAEFRKQLKDGKLIVLKKAGRK